MLRSLAAFAVLSLALGIAPAQADLIAISDTSITLTSTSVAFFSPGGAGQVTLGQSSTGAFAGLGGTTATLQAVTTATPFPLTNFLALQALPNAHFTLTSIGPGSANTNCFIGSFQVCSPPLSPFVLTSTPNGTIVSFNAAGTVSDGSGAPAPFTAVFSTEVTGKLPSAVVSDLGAGGSLTEPFSASIRVASGPFAGTVDLGLPTTTISNALISFAPGAVPLGPTSTASFAAFAGTSLTLQSISAGAIPLPDFLTLAAIPNADFTLTTFGPGASLDCSVAGPLQPCSPGGSPLVFINTGSGVLLSFVVAGTTLDTLSAQHGAFQAMFVSEVAGVFLPSLLSSLQGGTPFTGSFSAEFVSGPFTSSSSSVPEPGTMLLVAMALALARLRTSRRRQARAIAGS